MEKNLERIKTAYKKIKVEKQKMFARLDDAFKNFDEIEENEGLPPIPNESTVWNYLLRNALLLVDNGEFRMARHILGDLLKRQPYHSDAVRWMGWCFKQEGDMPNALKCYEQLINIRKSDQDFYELGEIYYELKENEKARDVWIRGLEFTHAESPRLFDLHKNLGNSYMRLGDLESAEENYNKAFTIRSHSDALQVNLGSLCFYKSDFKNSFEYFKAAIDINPYNDRAWCGVGLVARQKNDKPWAKDMVLKSLDLNPENLIALQILVQWALEDKDYESALERVYYYSFKNQNDTNMIYSLAGLLFKAGMTVEAELELERLLAVDPENGDALQLLDIINMENYEQT